jgi:hypothetical protein
MQSTDIKAFPLALLARRRAVHVKKRSKLSDRLPPLTGLPLSRTL